MLTVQACQLVCHASQKGEIVSRGKRACGRKLVTAPPQSRKHGMIRSEESGNAGMSHGSKTECRRWRNRGVVGVPHPTRPKDQGKNLLGRHLDLSERRRVFAREKRRRRRTMRKTARMKTHSRQSGVSAEQAHVRQVQPSRSSGQTVSATSTPC